MAASAAKGRWRRVLRYAFGGAMCLLAVGASRAGLQWYWSVIVLCGAFLMILGRRRIFRPGVTRTPDEIVCRYVPWYEGNAYYLNLALPLTGVATAAAGFAPGNPVWLRFGGIMLLVLTPLFTSSAIRMWRRSSLRITPSTLTVGVAASKDDSTVIRRELVQSIEPKIVPNGVGGQWLQVAITYHPADLAGETTKTELLGLQLSVEPINLVNALAYWQDATRDDPSELLDRIELILRGKALAGV